MMDAQLLFSDAQAVTASAGSTNVIDAGASDRIGSGTPLYWTSLVTAINDAGSLTAQSELRGSAVVGMTSEKQLLQTSAFAPPAAGDMFSVPAPLGIAYEFYDTYYTLGNTTSWTTTTWLALSIQTSHMVTFVNISET